MKILLVTVPLVPNEENKLEKKKASYKNNGGGCILYLSVIINLNWVHHKWLIFKMPLRHCRTLRDVSQMRTSTVQNKVEGRHRAGDSNGRGGDSCLSQEPLCFYLGVGSHDSFHSCPQSLVVGHCLKSNQSDDE